MQTIGVIADTHIPDRAKSLPQQVLQLFKEAQVSAILHAGDICTPAVINTLQSIAPVYAVKGNRDVLFFNQLPSRLDIKFDNVKIGMSHSHGNLFDYLLDKLQYLIRGPGSFKVFEERVVRAFPEADVIIYGHSHAPRLQKIESGQTLFNPGSPQFPNILFSNLKPSVGLIDIDGSQFQARIVFLEDVST